MPGKGAVQKHQDWATVVDSDGFNAQILWQYVVCQLVMETTGTYRREVSSTGGGPELWGHNLLIRYHEEFHTVDSDLDFLIGHFDTVSGEALGASMLFDVRQSKDTLERHG